MKEENFKYSSLTFYAKVKIFYFSQSHVKSKAILEPTVLASLYSKARTFELKSFRGDAELYTKPWWPNKPSSEEGGGVPSVTLGPDRL